MKLILNKVKPFSINNAYYKQTFTMTRECRQWRFTVIKALSSQNNLTEITKFRESFNPKLHGIALSLKFIIPHDWFYTQEGEVSLRSMDLSNVEKLLIDILFDKRFTERRELANLNINDKAIIHLDSQKHPGNSWKIIIEAKLIELKDNVCKKKAEPDPEILHLLKKNISA